MIKTSSDQWRRARRYNERSDTVDARTVMQHNPVPVVREILIHHDGHERHKISEYTHVHSNARRQELPVVELAPRRRRRKFSDEETKKIASKFIAGKFFTLLKYKIENNFGNDVKKL